MTIEELKAGLREIKSRYGRDEESDHADADDLLIAFIGDEEVKALFDSIDKWYA